MRFAAKRKSTTEARSHGEKHLRLSPWLPDNPELS
jgi:hypothetical protein